MKLRIASLALALAGPLAGPASAQTYVSGGLGASWYGADCPADASCDETDIAGKLQIGHRYASGIGVDLSVFDHGKLRGNNATILGLPANYRIDGSGFGLRAAYFLDFETHWVASVHAGVARTKSRISGGSTDGSVVASDYDRSHTVGYYGLSVHYRFSPSLSVGLDADFTDFRTQTAKFDGSAYLLTARYAF